MPPAKTRRAAGRSSLSAPAEAPPHAALSREQLLDLYYWMRLTRTLEEAARMRSNGVTFCRHSSGISARCW
jgi:TPP-dependent pyruvate/acetoin dehydrogenase alpha subunit